MVALTSADRDFYDSGVPVDEIAPFVEIVRLYTDAWATDRAKWFKGRTGVRVLELGAGSCTTSFMLTREPYVAEVVAGDLSIARVDQFRPHVEALTGGDASKLTLAEVDMNEAFPFGDGEFDLVVMDSALHHSRSIWLTLAEVHRVLKPGGYFVAQREHYLAPLTSRMKMRAMLRSEEVISGVSENAYLREQYAYYLAANGFQPSFSPVYPSLKFKALRFLNGLAFSKYNILARRVNEVARPV